jgi:beta-glucosidase/6-phospho-beta-glucosidase/beta-galactosidase
MIKKLFNSPILGGFECAYAKTYNGTRLDLLSATKHDEYVVSDYQLLKAQGIKTVREGFAWHQIDTGLDNYDFSRFIPMIKAGVEANVEQIWDLNHFDYPDDLDPLSPEFITRFSAYAKAAVKLLRQFMKGTIYIVPINEISFFSFIGAHVGNWAPFYNRRGTAFKRQLVKASITAMDAIWTVDKNVRFIQVDPIFTRIPKDPNNLKAQSLAKQFFLNKFAAWDMLTGKINPELGGHPKYLDICGVNYYYYNQEWIKISPFGKVTHQTITLKSRSRQSLRILLGEVYERYHRPILITETGGWGELRPKWWRLLLRELPEAIAAGIPISGVCAYPVIDRPDWDDGHLTNSGLWDFKKNDENLTRIPHHESLKLIKEIGKLFST